MPYDGASGMRYIYYSLKKMSMKESRVRDYS